MKTFIQEFIFLKIKKWSKKSLLPLFSILWIHVHAQLPMVNSLQIFPSNPVSTDTIYLIVTCTFSSGDCALLSSNVQVLGSNVQVDGNYCPGMLTVICTSIDTVKIGTLLPGNYSINFSLNLGNTPGCNQFSSAANSVIPVQVTGPTSINQNFPDENNFVIESVPGYGNFIFKSTVFLSSAILKIYSSDGKIAFQKQLGKANEELNLSLAPGIYYYKLDFKDKTSRAKTLIIF